jgi:hypothetical protein
VGGQRQALALCSLERAPVPTEQVWWCPGPIWITAEIRKSLAFTGVQTPNLKPVANRYTDQAIPTLYLLKLHFNIIHSPTSIIRSGVFPSGHLPKILHAILFSHPVLFFSIS